MMMSEEEMQWWIHHIVVNKPLSERGKFESWEKEIQEFISNLSKEKYNIQMEKCRREIEWWKRHIAIITSEKGKIESWEKVKFEKIQKYISNLSKEEYGTLMEKSEKEFWSNTTIREKVSVDQIIRERQLVDKIVEFGGIEPGRRSTLFIYLYTTGNHLIN
jgi:hypothetical protein